METNNGETLAGTEDCFNRKTPQDSIRHKTTYLNYITINNCVAF